MKRTARITAPLAALAVAATSLFALAFRDPATGRQWGPYFGAGNLPVECVAEMEPQLADGSDNPDWWEAPRYRADGPTPDARCHHMAADMNGLDDPVVDVLIVPPASPTPERDLRITRQSLEMWDAGIDAVATALELEWLAEGFEINISVGGAEYLATDEYNPASFYDPEIVVIVSNPVGGIGIGIDPADFFGFDVPCSPVEDPLSYESWTALDRFDAHHDGVQGGTYVARDGECGDNIGGNVCFAVNGAVDPTPGVGPVGDFFSLYDLVSHEVGHCLTIGHAGDGAEGTWAKVPTDDIMAYSKDPVRANKCVSTLNVQGIALSMSRYLDVDGNGTVGDEADQAAASANDPDTRDGRPFFVQRPEDQFYASESGLPWDCPQPDLGPVPGERTDFAVEPRWDPRDADDRDVEWERFCWEHLDGRC